LTVSFVPIVTGEVTRFVWDFGDGAKSSEPTPTHTYTLPGTYDVTLIGTPGFPSQTRAGFVVVSAHPLGGSCDVDSQCESGSQLACVCGSACPAAFTRGICTRSCAVSACPQGAICADLSLGAAPGAMDPWRSPLCLRACSKDEECAPGQRCRLLPSTEEAADGPRWTRACFVGFPGDLGASCRGANGQLQNELCAGGRCADLGALGVCSLDCTQRSCPEGTACAAFGDGRRLCLRPCSAAFPCSEDPLLSCVPPGAAGTLGFTISGAAASDAYCAPKPCTAEAACAPAGTCQAPGPAGRCVRRMAGGG
jgi:hypothetical protein